MLQGSLVSLSESERLRMLLEISALLSVRDLVSRRRQRPPFAVNLAAARFLSSNRRPVQISFDLLDLSASN